MFCFMVFNATFNNISVISWRSVLLVEDPEKTRPVASHWQILSNKCCIEYTSTWAGFEHTTLVVIDTDCIGSCKSNYHTITTMTSHFILFFLKEKNVASLINNPFQNSFGMHQNKEHSSTWTKNKSEISYYNLLVIIHTLVVLLIC